MNSRTWSMLGVLAAATALGAPSAAAKVHLRIAANAALIDTFGDWTAGQSWEDIKNFKNPNAVRPVVDLLLELQALKAGGLDFDFEFVRTLTYDTSLNEVLKGSADLSAETIWDADIAKNDAALFKTPPVIRDGELIKGIYVLPTRSDLLKISTIEELRENRGIVVGGWLFDVQTLENMKLKQVLKAVVPAVAFTRIRDGKADFILMEFSSRPDLSMVEGGVRLVPVPNCTVVIAGSRSWIVSKNTPAAQEIHQALVAGVEILRANGTIERTYKESGFINAQVSGWKRLF